MKQVFMQKQPISKKFDKLIWKIFQYTDLKGLLINTKIYKNNTSVVSLKGSG